jgi:hypothetical protein
VIVSDQFSNEPWSAAWSSKTHRRQVPFGFSPSKADSALPCGGPGAGAGKSSLQQPVA